MWAIPYAVPDFLTDNQIQNNFTLYLLLVGVLSTIIQFFMGAPFYVAAYKAVSHGAANMDVLVVLGTTSAWLYGIILILMQLPEEEDVHALHDMSEEAMAEHHMESHR